MNGTNTTMGTQYFYNNLFQGLSGPALDNANVWRNNICGEGFEVRGTDGGAAQNADYNLYWDDFHRDKPIGEGSHSTIGEPGFLAPTVSAETGYGLDADWHVTSKVLRRGVADSHSPVLDKGGRTRVTPITVGPYEYTGEDTSTPTLSIGVSSAYPAYGSLDLRGSLRDEAEASMPNRMVEIWSSPDGAGWSPLTAVRTSAAPSGSFLLHARPTRRTYYRAVYAGDEARPSGYSPVVRVLPKVSVTKPYRRSTVVKRGRTYVFTGRLYPPHDSAAALKVLAYRRVRGKYVYSRAFYAAARPSGIYQSRVKLPLRGKWRLRAFHAADLGNASTYSEYRYVTVR
jgi:hypothetical protein